ncbi:hypothetical protein NHJ13051_009231, partial [Beauveria bassiana]
LTLVSEDKGYEAKLALALFWGLASPQPAYIIDTKFQS